MRTYTGKRFNENDPEYTRTGHAIKVTYLDSGLLKEVRGVKPLPIQPSRDISSHSSEFNWGYGGSGPAQLALALVYDAIKQDNPTLSLMEVRGKALYHYQDFKWAYVIGWDDTWEITSKDIVNWLWKEFGA